MPSITLNFNEDGTVTWKPAGSAGGAARTADDDWIDGPACPIHGAWNVVARKDGSGYFYSCEVPKGEAWCKKKVSTREGTWGALNPPTAPSDDGFDEAPWPEE